MTHDFSIRQAIFSMGPLIPRDPIAINLDVIYTGTNVASGIVNIILIEIINTSVISAFAEIRRDVSGTNNLRQIWTVSIDSMKCPLVPTN